MRILIQSLYFHPDQTGICKYSGEMAKWLAQRGHVVDVVTGYPHYPEWRLAAPYTRTRFAVEHWERVTVHRVPHYIPSGGSIGALQRMLVDATFLVGSLLKWLQLFWRRDRFDVVIAVCPPMFTGLPALLSRVWRGVPWVYHIQDFQVDAALRLGILNRGAFGRLLYWLENRLIQSATVVSSITPAMCRRAIAKGTRIETCWLLPNWADIQNLGPGPTDNAFRRSLGIDNACFLAVYAGAMGAKQGLDLVVDTAAQLRDESRFRFLMVGAGPEWQRLRDRAAAERLDNVRFLPVQPIERLGELLTAADVHLVIQKAEAADLVMPSKLTNILAVGRPAIATAAPETALWDVLEGHEAGSVIPPDDRNALARTLRHLADRPDIRKRMGENARRYAEENLDQTAILARFEYQLEALVQSHNGESKE